jgi:N utilization substance protein A
MEQDNDNNDLVEMFMSVLRIGKAEAKILVAEGFTSLEEVAYVPINEMYKIIGLTQEQITQIRVSAKEHLLN